MKKKPLPTIPTVAVSGGKNRVACAACGDPVTTPACETCVRKALKKKRRQPGVAAVLVSGRVIFVQKHCDPCHNELFHGNMPRVTDGRPGGVGRGHRSETADGEDSPWHENAVGDMEDGGA